MAEFDIREAWFATHAPVLGYSIDKTGAIIVKNLTKGIERKKEETIKTLQETEPIKP